MTESPFDRISQNLLEVSNRPEDLDWVQIAFGMLLKENVRPSRAESAINGCIRAIADTGESAHQLFGDPSEWVFQKTANWRQKGTQAFELNEPMNWWWSCLLSFFGAAKTSVLFWLYCLLSHETTSSNMVIFSLGIGLMLGLIYYVYAQVVPRRGFAWAIAAGGATTVGLSFSLAFALEQAQHLSRPVPIWWHLVAALGMLALIVLFYKLVPEPANRQGESNHNPSDQHAWLRTFRTELNKRNDMTDARVRDEVALVLAHSRETGTTFDEEFGHPVTYARSLAGQSSVKPYRLMLYAFFMVAAGIYWFYSALTAGDGSVWWRVPLGLFVLIILTLEAKASWATYRSSRQASAPDA